MSQKKYSLNEADPIDDDAFDEVIDDSIDDEELFSFKPSDAVSYTHLRAHET